MPGVANAPRDKQPALPPPPATWKPNKDDQVHLDALDVALNRMREILPSHPYVMTIPQDVEPRYHHQYAIQATQWLSNTPFTSIEHEASQYLTHHYYEPGKEIYMLHNSQPIGDSPSGGNSAKQNTRASAGANTPNTGPKKKISLDAYIKKQSVGLGTVERDGAKMSDATGKQQQPALKGPVERVKAETQEMLAAVAEDHDQESRMRKDKSPEHGDLKRKRDPAMEQGEKKELADSMEPDRNSKRQRIEKAKSPRKEASASMLRRDGVETEDHAATTNKREEEAGLPPRLSPGMPPRLSPGLPEKLSPLHKAAPNDSTRPAAEKDTEEDYEDRLPPRLSPTLPENIEKTLQARIQSQSSHSSNAAVPDSTAKDEYGKQSPIRKSESGITKHKSSVPRNGFRAKSSSPAMRPELEGKPRASKAASRAKTPDIPQDDETSVGKSSTATRLDRDEQKASLVLKLKFKKTLRVRLARILSMKATPSKSMKQLPSPQSEDTKLAAQSGKRSGERKEEAAKAKGVAQKVGPVRKDKKPAVEERPVEKAVEKVQDRKVERPSEKSSGQEKRKLPEDEKPEPAAKRKKLEVTDTRKQPSTPASREVDSPQAQKSQHVTPSTRKDLLSQAMKREQSQDSNQTHTPPALANTPTIGSSQVNGIHRPPSSQPSNKTPKQQAWETEQKQLEKLGRELKHEATAHISAKPAEQEMAAVKSMESFLCYLLAFTCADEAAAAADPKQAPSARNWRSLTGFYGFVKHHTGQYSSLNGLAYSLGVVFCARILEISILVADGPNRDPLSDTQALLQKSALVADEKLDIDILQEAFPRTWKERTKKLAPHERLEPTKLAGPYKLPLGVATSPIRAARAGYAMLQEWMQKEGIQYNMRLKL